MPLAEPFEGSLTRFQKLLVLRCLRPDRVLAAVRDFVASNLGQRFIEPPPFDLAACFKESSPATPLVFVLSPGTFSTFSADHVPQHLHAAIQACFIAAGSLLAACEAELAAAAAMLRC